MGDAPLNAVKEIAVADIHSDPLPDRNLEALVHSVREVGVLQPLLMRPEVKGFRLISGINRLAAARRAGLLTVPCLVYDISSETADSWQQALRARTSPTPAPPAEPPAAPPVPAASPTLEPTRLEPTGTEPPAVMERNEAESASADAISAGLPEVFAHVTQTLEFVSALLPALSGARSDSLAAAVVTDVLSMEVRRAKVIAAAGEVLAYAKAPVTRETLSAATLIEQVVASAQSEARFRGVQLEVSVGAQDTRFEANKDMLATTLTGILFSLLRLKVSPPGSIRLSVRTTTVRPALVVDLRRDGIELSDQTVARLFDGHWREHPAGSEGALLFEAAARAARLHGGRLGVESASGALTVTLVIPLPL
ncbi:MAG: ParB N-terminal domain-containing protein [Acidobacteria bacterium]|nr:ParB N-terminal domain-containing protein [Acidobacteriota bacterium]